MFSRKDVTLFFFFLIHLKKKENKKTILEALKSHTHMIKTQRRNDGRQRFLQNNKLLLQRASNLAKWSAHRLPSVKTWDTPIPQEPRLDFHDHCLEMMQVGRGGVNQPNSLKRIQLTENKFKSPIPGQMKTLTYSN